MRGGPPSHLPCPTIQVSTFSGDLIFVDSRDEKERSLDELLIAVKALSLALEKFTQDSAEANVAALTTSIDRLVKDLEMGINTETQEVMTKFRSSTETLYEWQQRYIEEIKNVTDAMDQNARVTEVTTIQLERTNDVLDRLGPVTETIAQSIGWVQKALPSFRPKGKMAQVNQKDTPENDGN